MKAKPFDYINHYDEHGLGIVAEFIIHEHPQTIALIASFIDKEPLKHIFNHFPQDLTAGIIMRIVRMGKVPKSSVAIVDRVLKKKLKTFDKDMHSFKIKDTLDKIRDIVEELPTDKIRGSLQAINQVDEEMFGKLTSHIAKTHPEKLI